MMMSMLLDRCCRPIRGSRGRAPAVDGWMKSEGRSRSGRPKSVGCAVSAPVEDAAGFGWEKNDLLVSDVDVDGEGRCDAAEWR